jgi:hypothetical protein
MTGARIGNWYLEAEIGRGPLGTVYKARGFDDPDRAAAVKVLTAPAARDPAFLQRFPAEMLALQRLDHPNIVRYYDSGIHGGMAYYAAELVEGTDAAKLLEGGRQPWPEVLSIAVQAARALKHGHNRNILHRDLKPAHVLITPDGTVKLAGFGLAKVVPPPPASATPAIGSAAYLPPETASGKPPTRRSDFYALGGVLYTLLTGRPPFIAPSIVELVHKQCYALPERPALLVRDLPPELDEFVCTLLDKNPARRPATAAALLEELERLRGKLERKGQEVVWPAKLVPDTAEMAPLPPGLAGPEGGGDEPDKAHREPRPLLKRPLVVVPLFLLAVAALVAGLAWPRKSADELWAAAAPLLESPDPADWDRAWDEYLEPLARKYPDRYAAEVAAAKERIGDRRELRRAITAGAKADARTDAERIYLRGLRLAQSGDAGDARRTWQGLVTAFGPVESERRWVELAKAGLAALDQPGNRPRTPPDRGPLEAAATHARSLAAGGKTDDAAAAFRALEDLFRDDPEALEVIRTVRNGK